MSVKHANLCRDKVNTSDISETAYVSLVRSVKLPSGTTYRYIFSRPSNSQKPFLLFLHGFPETSYGWYHQIMYFTKQGYGVIAPDLLGYGGTDNPADLGAFNFKRMAAHLGELLDHEGVDTAIGIAHDFGAPLLSRFINYHPSRLTAVVFLSNGYFPPHAKLDALAVDSVNNATLAYLGYEVLGFWPFFDEADASAVLDGHQESFYSIAFTRDTSSWGKEFAPSGALRQWLEQDKIASDVYISDVDMQQWKSITTAQGGFEGPLRWYKAIMRGYNNPDDTDLNLSGIIPVPLLLIVGDRDPVAVASSQLSETLRHGSDVRVRTVDAGHFPQLEAPQETNRHLDLFFRDVARNLESGTGTIAVSYERIS